MRDAIGREQAAGDDATNEALHDLHAAVAGAAGNRVLELVALVLIRLSRLQQIDRLALKARKQARAEVLRAHEAVAAAVESGDRELSRHRMHSHLDALATMMRSPGSGAGRARG